MMLKLTNFMFTLNSNPKMQGTFSSILYWCNSKLRVRTGHHFKITVKGKMLRKLSAESEETSVSVNLSFSLN